MPDACEIRVYVRSRKVVTSAQEIRTVVLRTAGLSEPVSVPLRRFDVTYGRRLDREQGEVLFEARRLAAETGSPLHVVDLGRTNPIVHVLTLARLGGRRLPAVILEGSCPWHRLGEAERLAPRAPTRT